ncbi:2-C-methyl-D-erythritol 4-phosphate cytidylyltransferase [Anaerocolumna aminovalerica]|uniref:2-C-methyl-D-erythritol 4-phosphate cytidylyltransferase n=1 Tax=Anaerocolumna aminovalerica TaxID=1527 RepID=A0A1I5HHZ4_9FIRM|nr:2-C-methyl-D-erythritol 4-phosphate cytidylyltransferase [Anaerocolumna aminovalerica]MBU5334647.1 2-C-methyl-D-erythritol 4-phosphate cytidylyltransferase [Anaerocolumna aminovalerica]SFO47863.1 2-C-methyl-D-erythritol 4-phosphate cytidylyltransferase [Anaerocolumna aminovalerica]
MEHKKIVAIILAAGTGKRMESNIPKQYLVLQDKPILYYSLKTFEESNVDEIILVVGNGEIEYCREEIVDKFKFKKVRKILEGGSERYHSVFKGLNVINYADYILIHDGARPFISLETINRTIEEVGTYNACVVGVPSKDTVKIVNEEGIVMETPNRDKVWAVQTPQAFSYEIIKRAYEMLFKNNQENLKITDDAMVVEYTLNFPVKLVMGDYTNIKITTPDDLIIGQSILSRMW